MLRALAVAACVSLAVLLFPADLRGCVLEISLQCPNGNCSSTTTNIGNTNCSGEIYSGFFGPPGRGVQLFASGDLTECFSTAEYPPEYFPQPFAFCTGLGTIRPGDTLTMQLQVTGTQDRIPLEAFTIVFEPTTFETVGIAWTSDQPPVPTCTPVGAVPSPIASGIPFSFSWTPVSEPGATYEVQESESTDFSFATSRFTSSLSLEFSHQVLPGDFDAFHYRVRAIECNGEPGPFSTPVSTVVLGPEPDFGSRAFNVTLPVGTKGEITQDVRVPDPGGAASHFDFEAPVVPWLSFPPGLTPISSPKTITIDLDGLPVGASSANLIVRYYDTPQKTASGVVATGSVPVSVSLVTPVSTGGKNAPPANALVIPAVAHVSGGAFFQSDVRITNPSAGAVEYEMFFTPSNANGLTSGRKTVIRVEAGQTVALNDVVRNFFGYAAPTDSVGGSMEIRPLRTSASLTRITSRTYSTSTLGTLGQFIPAVPVTDFIGTPILLPGETPPEGPPPPISLQQVAENSRFRTNLGLVEGSGEAVSGRIRVLSGSGQVLSDEAFTLQPAEHRQLNRYLSGKGLTVDDARIEVQVESSLGRVTSYASVVDNETQDPFLVAPARPSEIRASRYVLPGVAALNNPGSNFFSDIRIFNGGTAATTATLRFVALPGLSGGGTIRTVTIAPGTVAAYDDVLVDLFGLAGTGGALIIDTPAESSLVVTGRTFSRAAKGTYGQFIPAITSEEGTALGEQPLQILQLEQSPEFRSNIGLVELTGRPVTVRLSTSLADSRAAPFVDVTLNPNEMRQYNSFLSSALNLGTAHNARVTVEVISGEGRVAAYGSVVDFRTSDPTFVPAK